jgi:hypothetical protein
MVDEAEAAAINPDDRIPGEPLAPTVGITNEDGLLGNGDDFFGFDMGETDETTMFNVDANAPIINTGQMPNLNHPNLTWGKFGEFEFDKDGKHYKLSGKGVEDIVTKRLTKEEWDKLPDSEKENVIKCGV